MNADEIVKALRICSALNGCGGCCYYASDEDSSCMAFITRDATDLIESLQAQLAEYKATGLTPGDVKDLQGLCKENGLAEYVDIIVEAKRLLSRNNEQSIEQDERIERLEAQLAESKRRERAAVEDMKVMALAMRESEELPEGCCFACVCDAQNLPDNCILAYGECPGYDTNDCFEWRGVAGKEQTDA